MPLISTTDQIKEILLVDAQFTPNSILPFLPLAEAEIIRVLGEEQYEELLLYVESGASGVDELDDLLPSVSRPLVYLAFLKGLDVLNVVITNNGIGVVSTTNLTPASEKRTLALKQNIFDASWDYVELLLSFLEKNNRDYPLWESSDAFAYQYKYLISSATKFNEFVPINRSRVTFLKLRPSMSDFETLKIAPAISQALLDELKIQIKSDTISDLNAAILPFLQKCLAYDTYAQVYESIEHARNANAYLIEAKKILDGNPDAYPLYRDSDSYIIDREDYQIFENDEDSNIAMF